MADKNKVNKINNSGDPTEACVKIIPVENLILQNIPSDISISQFEFYSKYSKIYCVFFINFNKCLFIFKLSFCELSSQLFCFLNQKIKEVKNVTVTSQSKKVNYTTLICFEFKWKASECLLIYRQCKRFIAQFIQQCLTYRSTNIFSFEQTFSTKYRQRVQRSPRFYDDYSH